MGTVKEEIIQAQEEDIREIVNQANRLSKKGKNNEALEQLDFALAKIDLLPDRRKKESLRGLAYHYSGRIWQTKGNFGEAIYNLKLAIDFRENDPVAKAYSVFQLFICKIYGKILISDEEVEETKAALTAAMANKAASIADIGNFFQNVAYIEQVKGSVEKAISFYEMALVVRERAGDERGKALTEARLAEVYWKRKDKGDESIAIDYGISALEYFKETGDTERIRQVNAVFAGE